MDSTKRKSHSDLSEKISSEGKHMKTSNNATVTNGTGPEILADSQNVSDFDQTQEYNLEDSDGFEFENHSASPTIHHENTQEYMEATEDGTKEQSVNYNSKDSEQASSKSIMKEEKPSMTKIQSVLKDTELISSIIPVADTDVVYEKVLKHRADKNRVDLVTNEVLESGLDSNVSGSKTNVSESSSEGIFEDVAEVLVKCPAADPNKVYEMLEKLDGNADRVTCVLNQLSKDNIVSSSTSDTKSSSLSKSSSGSDPFSDPAFKNNPLYKDLRTLRKVLPGKDPAELYAYLEAHFDKGNRVQIVIDEFTKSDSQESLPNDITDSVENCDKGKQPATLVDKLQCDLQELKEIFPDCDPDFLYEQIENLKDDPERVRKVAAVLFENKQYPKLKERLEKEKKEEMKNRIRKREFSMTEFLQKFPEPFQFFEDIDRQMSKNYQDHVLVYMKNTYPFLKDGYIRKVLENSKQHLTPAVKEVDNENFDAIGRTTKKMRATPRQEVLAYPDDPDELFFQELKFCENQGKIKDYFEEKKHVRELKLAEAKKIGELFECGCCYDDELLFEEMGSCADGHIFCKECIVRSSQAAVGEGKTKFPCLTGVCDYQFPLALLQQLLPANTFSLALRKMQEEELQLADIPDLVPCPFCSFATIMPDPEDKVFRCLNPECLKDSCRLCKEPNHVPLRCNEVEKQGETNMRAYIETKMSEAMLRTCPNCKKRFVKQDGCNKMTCPCGTSMCYVCQAANIDYGHFDNGGCAIDSDLFTMHKEEMLKAAEEARQEYLRDHPDLEQDQQLKYDPVKLLERFKNQYGVGYVEDDGEDDFDEYDDDNDGYDDGYDDDIGEYYEGNDEYDDGYDYFDL